MSVKRSLINHLLAGEVEPVLRALTVLADQIGDNTLMNEVVHQHTRFTQLERERRAGTMDPQAARLKSQRIQQTLLLIIESLPTSK